MLTETQARELLARAAATIDVAPGTPLPTVAGSRRRRLMPAIAAAAAVLLIVATAAALVRDDGARGTAPAPGPAAPDGVTAAAGIPSVFGYDADSAEAMLTEEGLVVTRKPSYTCRTPGRAVRTAPATGTRFDSGDPVSLFVTEPSPVANCLVPAEDALAWQLLDFANGRGPAPAFAAEVDVYANGVQTTLTGAEAADPQSWAPESALGILATASRQERRGQNGRVDTPGMSVHTDDGSQFVCGGQDLPADLAGRQSLWLSIGIPSDSVVQSCTFANVYRTGGQIDAIVVRSWGSLENVDPEPPPDPDPDLIGARFLAFARGEIDQPPVDTPVRVYVGNEYQKTISAAATSDPSSWEVCAAYAERSCPMSAVTTLREFDHRPAVTDQLPGSCLDTLTSSPTYDDTGGNHVVVLGVAEPRMCADDFAVQIWSNDVGQITAVNLLLGSP